jgi:hypothetical protein
MSMLITQLIDGTPVTGHAKMAPFSFLIGVRESLIHPCAESGHRRRCTNRVFRFMTILVSSTVSSEIMDSMTYESIEDGA